MTTRDKLEYQKRLRFLRESRSDEQLRLAKNAEESDLTKPLISLGDKENPTPQRGEAAKDLSEIPETRETSRVKNPVKAGDEGDNILDVDLSEVFTERTRQSEDARQALGRAKKRKKNTRTKRLKRKSQAQIDEAALKILIKKYVLECACQMKQPFDAPEDEHQGYMLVQSLSKLADQTSELADVANHDDNPEPWVEFKVNSASEQIDAVHDYIRYGRKHRPDMKHHELNEYTEEMRESLMRKTNLEKLLYVLLEQQMPGMPGPDGLINPWANQSPTIPPNPYGSPPQAARPRGGRSRTFNDARTLVNFLLDPRQPNGPTAHINWLATRPSPQQLANMQRYVGAAIRNRIPELLGLIPEQLRQPAENYLQQIRDIFNQALQTRANRINPATLREYVRQLTEIQAQLGALLSGAAVPAGSGAGGSGTAAQPGQDRQQAGAAEQPGQPTQNSQAGSGTGGQGVVSGARPAPAPQATQPPAPVLQPGVTLRRPRGELEALSNPEAPRTTPQTPTTPPQRPVSSGVVNRGSRPPETEQQLTRLRGQRSGVDRRIAALDANIRRDERTYSNATRGQQRVLRPGLQQAREERQRLQRQRSDLNRQIADLENQQR